MKKTIFFRSFIVNLLTIVAVLAVSLFIAGRVFESWYQRYLGDEMAKIVSLSQTRVLAALDQPEQLQQLLKEMSQGIGVRFTVIDPDGRVLADSVEDSRKMENHRDRPEIATALLGQTGKNLRFSTTEMARMFYLAEPLRVGSEALGVLRVSIFARDIEHLISRFQGQLQIGGVLLLILALVVTVISARSLSRPIRALAKAAKEITMGNYDARVYAPGSGEIAELADAFNEMAERQKALITSISERQNELRTVMDAMSEGLLVICREGDIMHYNQAAQGIFPELKNGGRKYWEVCRSADIYSHIQEGFDKEGLSSREVTLGDQAYRINAIAIEKEDRLVITFHNITEFRRLERIKKDFIANISHEIKTPLTTIHGFVETLEEQLEGEPLRYLSIIKRNSERLTNLVKDLLLLSRLEESGLGGRSEPVNLKDLIESILPVYEPVATAKGLEFKCILPQGPITVIGDAGRLEDMLINLLDNAVKYSEAGGVTLELSCQGSRAVIEVSDTGIGISAEHLERIFERFYVVDPSRSKQSGGTGLGLAIVKHIVAHHQGSLEVDSRIGEGSRFTVSLPLRP